MRWDVGHSYIHSNRYYDCPLSHSLSLLLSFYSLSFFTTTQFSYCSNFSYNYQCTIELFVPYTYIFIGQIIWLLIYNFLINNYSSFLYILKINYDVNKWNWYNLFITQFCLHVNGINFFFIFIIILCLKIPKSILIRAGFTILINL